MGSWRLPPNFRGGTSGSDSVWQAQSDPEAAEVVVPECGRSRASPGERPCDREQQGYGAGLPGPQRPHPPHVPGCRVWSCRLMFGLGFRLAWSDLWLVFCFSLVGRQCPPVPVPVVRGKQAACFDFRRDHSGSCLASQRQLRTCALGQCWDCGESRASWRWSNTFALWDRQEPWAAAQKAVTWTCASPKGLCVEGLLPTAARLRGGACRSG